MNLCSKPHRLNFILNLNQFKVSFKIPIANRFIRVYQGKLSTEEVSVCIWFGQIHTQAT